MRMISCDDRSAPFIETFKRTAARAGYAVDMVTPAVEPSPNFTRLRRAYRHLSPNPIRFELASFRRWYEIGSAARPRERFVLADSDLVVFTPWNELPEEIRDFEGLVGSIGATSNVSEEGINGGFSVWTGEMLADFCAYMSDFYETRSDELAETHGSLIAAGNPRASISDMTLLYRWVRERSIPFFNTNRLLRDAKGDAHYIDHNFFMPEGVDARFRTAFGRKALTFEGGRAYLRTREGTRVTADSLHLGGRYKILASAIERGDQVTMAAKSAYILGGRMGRKLLQRLRASAS